MSYENPPESKDQPKTQETAQLSPEAKERAEMERSAKKMFLEIKAGKETPAQELQKLSVLINAPEFAELLSQEQKDFISKDLQDVLQIKAEDQFVAEVLRAVKPLQELKHRYPELYEDAQARFFTDNGKFIPLNKRISYGLHNDDVHFHLAPSFAVKDKLPELFFDAMAKLKNIVGANEEIKKITGTSWIVATKKYGSLLAKLGFEITEVPERIKSEHFQGEKRPMKMASMTRDKFLNTNWNWEDVQKLLNLEK